MPSFSVMALFLFLACISGTTFSPEDCQAEAQKKTTLRFGEPKGTFRNSAGTLKIVQVDLQVRNVGDYPADDMRVAVVAPGGQRIELSGPESLGPNKAATYSSGTIFEYITQQGKLKADVHCTNCNN